MGIYGTIMTAFGDQMTVLKTFKMSPEVTAGFSARTSIRTVRGFIRMYSAPPTAEGVKVKVPSFQGAGKGNAVIQKWPFFFTSKELPVGDFIEWKTEVYRVVSENIFTGEMSVCCQGLEKVVGLNGAESNDLSFNTGEHFFN
jgi:hypothetical protein